MGRFAGKTEGDNGATLYCLVVEDDALCRKMVCRLLTDTPFRVAVEPVGTLAAAREHLISGCFDLILVDHHLPDGFGGEFLARCVSARMNRWAKCYLLTSIPDHARYQLEDLENGIEVLDKTDLDPMIVEGILGDLMRRRAGTRQLAQPAAS